MTSTVIMTKHAIERAMERYGFSEKQITSRACSAFLYGKRAEDFESADERRYLENKARDGSFAVAYNKRCFIYQSCNVFVTTYELPFWFGKTAVEI